MFGHTPSLQFMKWLSFIALVMHNSGVIVVTRYSRIVLPNEVYLSSTAVVMMELSKLLISLVGYYFETRSTFSLKALYNDVAGPESDYLSMAVPASLYFVQNSLQFYATMYLDPATFQITNQGKILTTAILSVFWLKKVLSVKKWTSLLLIAVGIVIVQVQGLQPANEKDSAGHFLGFLAMVAACFLSGFAGVWFEGALKGKKVSLFLRNVQLSLFSLIPGFFIAVCLVDGPSIQKNGFFYGYTAWAWAAILLQASGGILVAVVVKYSDIIMKVIATTLAVVMSSILTTIVFGVEMTVGFVGGSAIVMLGTFLYLEIDPGHIALFVKRAGRLSKKGKLFHSFLLFLFILSLSLCLSRGYETRTDDKYWLLAQKRLGWRGSSSDFFRSRMHLWFQYALDNGCSLDSSDYTRISTDLARFKGAMVNFSLASTWDNLEVIQISDGKVSTLSGKDVFFFKAVFAFAEHLPDMTLLVNELDEPRVLHANPTRKRNFSPKVFRYNKGFNSYLPNDNGDVSDLLKASCDRDISSFQNQHSISLGPASFSATANRWPIFSFSTIEGCFDDIIIPNFNFYDQSPLPPTGIPGRWEEKKDVLHWRGTSTGGDVRVGNDAWKGFQRHRLVNKFGPLSDHSDDIDIAFTKIYQDFGNDYIGEGMDRTAREDKFSFKYIVDMDGSVSTERFLALLRFDMLVLKSTIFRDWVLDRVEPWVHYIPINLDYSDLISKFTWAKENQMASNTIALEAKHFSQRNLRPEDMECYSFRLLLEYARLFN